MPSDETNYRTLVTAARFDHDCSLLRDQATFDASVGKPDRELVRADVHNYTDIAPVMQISRVDC